MLKSNLQDDSSVLGGGDFGRWLGLQDETLMGFVPLLKEAPESFLIPFHTLRTQQEGSGYESGRGLSPEWDHAVIFFFII